MHEEWARRLHNFDIHAVYSDDHRVWQRYQSDYKQLVADADAANLTETDKARIMSIVGANSDKLYLEAKARWGNVVADQPLWADQSNDRYVFCKGILKL
jgi:hypothetical protein